MAAQGLPLEMDRMARQCPGARVRLERREGVNKTQSKQFPE